MHPLDYTINRYDMLAYVEGRPNKLDKIWADIVSKLPLPVQQEAWAKGYSIQELAQLATQTTRVFELFIRSPSPELFRALDSLYTQVLYLD